MQTNKYRNHFLNKSLPLVIALTGISSTAMAHIIPTNFGTFDGLISTTVNKNGGVSGNYGWIDGTDADWGDSHKTTWFSFTLTGKADVSLAFTEKANAFGIKGLNPGFTLYQGVPHPVTGELDHDYSDGSILLRSIDCAATPGCITTEGSLRTLTSFRITNDDDPTGTSPSFFTYVGHAYDGSQNYGTGEIAGGDGLTDHTVSASFQNLLEGNYIAFVGGSNYASQSGSGSYGIGATFTITPSAVVPVPGAVWLFGSALTGLLGVARRKSTAQ